MSRFEPIAVVGQGCVLPGALTPGAFWENVISGRDLVTDVPDERWRIAPALVAGTPDACADATYSTAGGYVTGFDEAFDAAGFALPASSIERLDPLFHWVLHASRAALLDAGLDAPLSSAGLAGGVVLGNLSFPSEAMARWCESVFLDEHARHLAGGDAKRLLGLGVNDARNRFMSGLPAHVAAKALGLERGGFCLDAACASSLYAIRIASDWLHEGRADVMLAGAVNRADSLFIHIGFCALKAMSPTGRSRPFHRGADGLVPAEGAAVVALMRLDDALRQGRRVLGVIRGVGLSNDGRAKSLLAPSSEGQVRALRAAYEMAGVAPSSVSLVECHATGTPVGDRTEVASMAEVFGGAREPVRIGSLKSNFGHLITAAGAAGLMKVLGALNYKRVPPTLHCDAPFDGMGAFRVVTAAEDWRHDDDEPRRAGVSAFGFGGNNAHLVIEEHGDDERRPAIGGARTISARDERLAIVGMGARFGDGGVDALRRAALEGIAPLPAREATLDVAGVRFPPNDLKSALPQQLLAFESARAAAADCKTPLDGARTGVLVGMGCDVDITSPGIRWRALEWTRSLRTAAPLPMGDEQLAAWTAAVQESVSPVVTAQGVLGQMPNIPANRVNVQLDLTGPGFTVSAEELSGLAALSIARSWLAQGELDAVIVGAVDVCGDVRHVRAVEALARGGAPEPRDAAVALVVKRASDAERDGDHIYAIVEVSSAAARAGQVFAAPALDDERAVGSDALALRGSLGHAHAASALLQLAAAALCLEARALPSVSGARPWLTSGGPPSARVEAGGLGGARAGVVLTASSTSASLARPVLLTRAAPSAGALASAPLGSTSGRSRLAAVGRDLDEARARLDDAAAKAARGEPMPSGAFFGEGELVDDERVALVFGGAAGPYAGMGRSLLLAFPSVTAALQARVGDLATAAQESWVFPRAPSSSTPSSAREAPYLEQLLAASCLSQAHALFSSDVLGLKAKNAIGYSLGESNALFALGAWPDVGQMLLDVTRSSLFATDLAGPCDAVRDWLRERGHGELAAGERVWASYTLRAPVDDVKRAVAGEPLAFVTIINTASEVVIGGHPDACDRVRSEVGGIALSNASAPAVHCEALLPVARAYRELHRRRTVAPAGVRFYGHAYNESYPVSDEGCADAILGQALATVNFPALVERAWRDGVRVFLDHGPRGLCAGWIRSVLGDRPHVAVALDAFGRSAVEQAAEAAAALFAAGVSVDVSAFAPRVAAAPPAQRITLPMVRALRPLPPPPTTTAAARQTMPRAPALPSVGTVPPMAASSGARALSPPAAHEAVAAVFDSMIAESYEQGLPSSAIDLLWQALIGQHDDMARAHTAFLEAQGHAHAAFLGMRAAQAERLAALVAQAPAPALVVDTLPRDPAPAPAPAPAAPRSRSRAAPLFDRRSLERLASGRISDVLGPLFARQDSFPRQVRMPEPPLLLCDRVLDVDAEPGVLATKKTILTETDVSWDSWYLHQGRIPPGILIEAGQADLLLISYMGVDFENKGERVYRLLGCDLTYHGELPRAGTTLHYDIHIDGFATHGATRLFFFHSDARAGGPDGEIVLSVRNGQAGFFSDGELAESGGVLWSPSDVDAGSLAGRPLDEPRVPTAKRALSRDELESFARGDLVACFGAGFERALTHVRTPAVQGGDMLLLDRVTAIEPRGGPWGRGYLRAELELTPLRWFFNGHFKDDPCMPGTLMFEGCLEAMSLYLAAQGFTLDRDGWRFEPVKGAQYKLRCRGQAIPSSRSLVYELFVKELAGGPRPRVIADILVTVDGLKSLIAEDVGVELVPDYPLTSRPELTGEAPKQGGRDAVSSPSEAQTRMLASGIGAPSQAFGDLYRSFDHTRRIARLPGPPYCFLTRLAGVDGDPPGKMRAGTTVSIDYDVPPDSWFFDERESPSGAMPFAVLMEVALQPCGWLSSYIGSMNDERDLYYRNLDGKARVHRHVGRGVGTLTTTTTMTGLSQAGGLSIQQFHFVTRDARGVVFEGDTTFGFFPSEALVRQVGVGASDDDKRRLAAASATSLALDERGIAGPMLLMLDRVTALDVAGGRHGRGYLRAEKPVDPRDWFYKAHFYEDPVQPGSLGVQAMLQGIEAFARESGAVAHLQDPVFEPIAADEELVWKYRGQIVPERALMQIELDVLDVKQAVGHVDVTAEAWLWCDGLRIYHAPKLTARARPGRS